MAEAKIMTMMGVDLPIMEDFYTIQGEGFHSGAPAYFIRLGGCDVGCNWCDVKESWDAEAHPLCSIDTILEKVKQSGSPLAIITGGEPLMYDMAPLCGALKASGIKTNIETSGAYELSGEWDWICLSPKRRKAPVASVCEKANELKVVIFRERDLEWAEEQAVKVNADCRLYLQPEWSKEKEMLPIIIEYAKKHPRWNISLQTHKYMDIP